MASRKKKKISSKVTFKVPVIETIDEAIKEYGLDYIIHAVNAQLEIDAFRDARSKDKHDDIAGRLDYFAPSKDDPSE